MERLELTCRVAGEPISERRILEGLASESQPIRVIWASRPVARWDNDRDELEALVLRADGPAFASARAEGCLLSIAEAAGLDAR